MKDWKEGLFNKKDYNWTNKQFEEWKVISKKNIKHYVNGRQDHKSSLKSISNIMYAHRMDKLKKLKLNPIEQSKKANELWKEHLKRINTSKPQKER